MVNEFDATFKGKQFSSEQPWWKELDSKIRDNKEKTKVYLLCLEFCGSRHCFYFVYEII